MLSHSVVSNSLRPHGVQPARLLCPWGFSRQEYWSGLACPPPGDLPNSGFESRSPTLQVDSLSTEPPGKHNLRCPTTKLFSFAGKQRAFSWHPYLDNLWKGNNHFSFKTRLWKGHKAICVSGGQSRRVNWPQRYLKSVIPWSCQIRRWDDGKRKQGT